MARVVQRRTNPPYLLILFVFLFLLATSLAVLFYINWDKSQKELTAEKTDARKIMSASDDDAAIKAMRDAATKNPSQSVVYQLKKQVEALAAGISPDKPTYEAAKTALDKTHEKYNDYISVIALLDRTNQKYLDDEASLAALRKQNTQIETEKQQVEAAKDELAKKQLADLAALTEQIKQLDEKFKAGHADYQSKIGEITDQISKKIGEYEKNINDKIKSNTDQGKKIAELNKIVQEQRDEIQRRTANVFDVTPKPDGKVTLVMDADRMAYVNLGSKDNVKVGLTLAVYPLSGITEEGSKPKAKLRVINVYPETSECTITEESNKDPVSANDLVSNLAYDTSRTFSFLVDGTFDIRGTGSASPKGLEEVKQLIMQSGGKITDELDIHCDFVVLGDAPVPPPKPNDADVTPQVEKVYKEQLKALEHYNDLKRQAQELKIPILNTNRFLALMGYVAPKVNR